MADADLADNGDASEEVQIVMNPSELLQQAGRVTGIQEASNLLSEAILSERQVDNHLNAILAKRSNVERGLANLKDSLGLLGLMQKHAESIAGSTKHASDLAEDVSRRVRELDASQSRVSEAMNRLDAIIEAEKTVEELKAAMDAEEYDKAAECIQNFTQLYFAVQPKPSLQDRAENGDAASTTGAGAPIKRKGSILDTDGDDAGSGAKHALRDQAKVVKECATQLRAEVLDLFERAAKDRDHEQVKRFAGILGPIGLVESGLQAFTKYLIGLISSRATEEYDALLAEISIPRNLESERKVDFNKALTGLYRDIAEAIEANTTLITEAYGEEGFVDVVLSLHQEAETRAVAILRKFIEYRQLTKTLEPKASQGQAADLGPASAAASDVKSFEKTIDEIVLLCVRSEEYNNCIKMVLGRAAETGVDKAVTTINALVGSPLNCTIRELNAYYTSLEDRYMERTIQMAIQMDECVDGALTSSIVEDAFFILQKCGRRGMATGNVQCVCSVLSNINNHLCNSFLSALRHDASVYDLLVGTLSEGDLREMDNTTNTAKAAQAVNNFDVSSEYIKKLKADLDMYTFEVFDHPDSRNRVQSCLSDLMKMSNEFQKISGQTIEHVAQRLLPELKPSIDALSSVSFNVSDSEYAVHEAEGPGWLSDLLARMEDHLSWLRTMLTSQNYESLVHSVLGHVAKRIEALLLQKRFNQLGGLLLEKYVRTLVNFTSNLTQRTVRDKFARLSQMGTLLNLETPQEVLDYWGDNMAEATMWRLTPFEVKRALKLRVDFRPHDVDELLLG